MYFIKNKPIYIQIAHDIVLKILNKEIKPATLLPSVRELSVTYKVTPKTIQAVTKYLDEHEIIKRKPGVGSVITNQLEKVKVLHYKHGLENTLDYTNYMASLHYTKEDILTYLEDALKGGKQND